MRMQWIARPASLLLLACAIGCSADVERITVLHVNDLHARLLPDDEGRGGFAHVASAIETERQDAANAIVLHAGDMVQGSPVSTIFQGTPVFEVANALGIDAHCLGNHEFDYGWEKIEDFEAASEAPIVCANVVNDAGKTLLRSAVVRRVGNLEVAVIGALTPRLPELIKLEQAGPWRAAPLLESLRPVVADMHKRVDLVIVLGHLFDAEDELLLRGIPDVDVLVSGHNHGGRETALEVDGRVGVKLRPYGRELGRLDITFDRTEGRIVESAWRRIAISQDRYAPHPTADKLVEHWEARVSEQVDVPVGECARRLGRGEVQALVERAIREKTGAELAYMNRGGVRDGLPRGRVTIRDVWNVLPFDNMLVEATVLGEHLPLEATEGRGVQARRRYRFVTNDFVAGQWRDLGIRFRRTDRELRGTFLEWVRERVSLP